MAGRRQAPPSHQRLLRALAAGSSLSFSIALLWLAPAGAAPSHSKTPKPGAGHVTPAGTPVTASIPAVASVPAAGVAAPVSTGAATATGTHPLKHAAKHSGGGAAKHRRTPASTGAGLAHGHAGAAEGSSGAVSGLGSSTNTAAATHEKLKVTHGRTKEAKRGRQTPKPPVTTVAGEGAAAASAASAAAAAVTAPVQAAPTSTAVAPAPTSGTASAGTTHKASAKHRRAARHAAKPRPAPATSGVLPFTAATPAEGLGGRATAATGTGNGGQGTSGVKEGARPHAESPIVTTVTKIINVVPPVWRWLIGALLALAVGLAVVSQVAAVRARRLARQRRELLDDVGLLQAALLPPLPRKLGPVGTSAAYRPASGPGAGGDFYDVFGLGDGRLAVIVGDVSGHGRHALPRTTLVRFTLRAYLEAGMEPRAALQMAGPVLERQLGEAFATVVLATYDPGERKLVYSSAGHPPPVVAGAGSAGDTVSAVTVCSAPPLGVGAPTGTRQTTVDMPGAALACFFTDGVVEARIQGQLFGSSRLERLVTELEDEATATTLLDRVSGAVDRRPDDMAACLLRFDGEPAAPAVALEEVELDGRSATRERVERFLLAGGLNPGDVERAASAVRSAVAEHRRVVLELRYADGAVDFAVRPLDVAMLKTWRAETGSAREMAG